MYGTAWKEARTKELVELALKAGFRGIDTANQRRHYCEAAVGEALANAFRKGLVAREDVFLQTKFTSRDGQDHRLPYDPDASLPQQVEQSVASSLKHLRTDYVDSLVLHGPSSPYDWTAQDAEVWEAMKRERDAGRARLLGVSNITLRQLRQMEVSQAEAAQGEVGTRAGTRAGTREAGSMPAFVQNRCFARKGWDRDIRTYCKDRQIVYQGFSLLTANVEVLGHAVITRLAARMQATPAQIVFAFARALGMLPLTGTSNAEHMKQDLASREIHIPPETVLTLEGLLG